MLCRLDELDDPGSAGFTIGPPEQPRRIMVVRRGDAVYGYRNSCPHLGAPLDWQGGRFLDRERRFLLCSMHGATFRIDDGYCLGGPCAGDSLGAVPLTLSDGAVWCDEF